ncbi:MAG: hypothetical protein H6729_17045 [Deltaproteobacteria bacterium]|nr:hypothetical protein [Deltaproteobacteria bacterium]
MIGTAVIIAAAAAFTFGQVPERTSSRAASTHAVARSDRSDALAVAARAIASELRLDASDLSQPGRSQHMSVGVFAWLPHLSADPRQSLLEQRMAELIEGAFWTTSMTSMASPPPNQSRALSPARAAHPRPRVSFRRVTAPPRNDDAAPASFRDIVQAARAEGVDWLLVVQSDDDRNAKLRVELRWIDQGLWSKPVSPDETPILRSFSVSLSSSWAEVLARARHTLERLDRTASHGGPHFDGAPRKIAEVNDRVLALSVCPWHGRRLLAALTLNEVVLFTLFGDETVRPWGRITLDLPRSEAPVRDVAGAILCDPSMIAEQPDGLIIGHTRLRGSYRIDLPAAASDLNVASPTPYQASANIASSSEARLESGIAWARGRGPGGPSAPSGPSGRIFFVQPQGGTSHLKVSSFERDEVRQVADEVLDMAVVYEAYEGKGEQAYAVRTDYTLVAVEPDGRLGSAIGTSGVNIDGSRRGPPTLVLTSPSTAGKLSDVLILKPVGGPKGVREDDELAVDRPITATHIDIDIDVNDVSDGDSHGNKAAAKPAVFFALQPRNGIATINRVAITIEAPKS